MNDALQKYGHCLLPDIGLLRIHFTPAEHSYQDNKLYPPSFNVVLEPLYKKDKHLFSIVQQIAFSHSLPVEEAMAEWSKTASAIREKLSTGSSVELEGLGFLNLDENGQIAFAASNLSLPLFEALVMEKPDQAAIQPEPGTTIKVKTKQPAGDLPSNISDQVSTSAGRKQSRSRWWVAGSIIVLLVIGWFTYKGTMQRRKEASHIKHILKKGTSARLATIDSLKLQSDTPANPQSTIPDSIHYTIVFAVYDNKTKAERQFRKMKNWGLHVVLIKKGPSTFELGMPFTSTPHDTTVNLVKMMKLYGNKVHIEYDRENELK